jgi:hypothetical protein
MTSAFVVVAVSPWLFVGCFSAQVTRFGGVLAVAAGIGFVAVDWRLAHEAIFDCPRNGVTEVTELRGRVRDSYAHAYLMLQARGIPDRYVQRIALVDETGDWRHLARFVGRSGLEYDVQVLVSRKPLSIRGGVLVGPISGSVGRSGVCRTKKI